MKLHLSELTLILLGSILVTKSTLKADSNWPSWRGVTGNGVAPDSSKEGDQLWGQDDVATAFSINPVFEKG